MKSISTTFKKNASKLLESQGMSLPQCNLLLVLDQTEGKSLSMKQFESILGIAQPTVTTLVGKLQKKGMVKQEYLSRDHRYKTVILTHFGESFCASVYKDIEKDEQKLLQPLQGQDRELFRKLLETIDDSLQKDKRKE